MFRQPNDEMLTMSDEDFLKICFPNEELCNENVVKSRLLEKYPDTLMFKPDDMTFRNFYLKVVYYVAKLKETFNYNYTKGNPRFIYSDLKDYRRARKLNLSYIQQNDLDQLLIVSARNGDLNKIKQLIKKGANINADSQQALRQAAGHGHLDIVKYLVERSPIKGHGYIALDFAKPYPETYNYLAKYIGKTKNYESPQILIWQETNLR